MLKALWKGLKGLRATPGQCNDYQERRDSVRIDCEYEVEYRVAGETRPGLVTDLSTRGLRMACSFAPKVGDRIDLRYPEGPDKRGVSGRVAWSRASGNAFLVGLAFDRGDQVGASWVQTLLSELGFDLEDLYQRRQFIRKDCDLTVRFAYGNYLTMGRLHNLGARGALLGLKEGPEVGVNVDLLVGPLADLEGLSLGGKVVALRREGVYGLLYSVEFAGLLDSEARLLGHYLKYLFTPPEED